LPIVVASLWEVCCVPSLRFRYTQRSLFFGSRWTCCSLCTYYTTWHRVSRCLFRGWADHFEKPSFLFASFLARDSQYTFFPSILKLLFMAGVVLGAPLDRLSLRGAIQILRISELVK